MEKNTEFYNSPIGLLKIEGNKNYITKVSLVSEIEKENKSFITTECKNQLEEYFKGERKEFDIEVFFEEGTDYQKKVWNALKEIAYGETRSYKDIAQIIGNPKGVRAVGGANNKNPIMIIVPCHRVIGANGKLVGYEGGVDKKEFLLNLEIQ